VNLARDMERRAREAPSRPALVHEDGRVWTYREIDSAARRVGAALAAKGVGLDGQVALFLENGPDLVFSIFGCWKIGAVAASLSGLYGEQELREALRKLDAAAILTSARLRPLAERAAPGAMILSFDAGELSGGDEADVGLAPDLPEDADSSIMFTGGTTGEPKAVRVTHGGTLVAMSGLARAMKGRPGPYDLAPEGTPPNLLTMPLFHSGGQQSLLFALHVGRSVALIERFRADVAAAMIKAHRIDNLVLLPTMVYDLAHCDGAADLSSVKTALATGGAVDPELRKRFERRFNVPILTNYGSTEIGHVAGWTARDVAKGLWRPGTAGRVYDGVEIEIRDADGAALPVGETGEICVRAALAKGYVDGAGDLVRDGWAMSGDIGRLDADRVLTLVGRKRELIKVGGFQVWPAEIEDALCQHPDVSDVAVVGVPDQRLGEIPKAFVVPRTRAADADAREALKASLIAHVRGALAHYKAIRDVAFVDALPRTEAGKINRRALT
jgi:long-chain acyl-CoA synthetase